MAGADGTTRGSRGRVVMLVDNAVSNDSRVQKQARSAAALGWDVTLVGRSRSGRKERFRIGRADVLLVPVSRRLAWRRHELGVGPHLPAPGYPTKRIARFREAQAEAHLADARLRAMRGRLTQEGGAPLRGRARVALAGLAVRVARTEGAWVARRARRTDEPLEPVEPRPPTSLRARVDRLRARAMGDRAWRVLHPHAWDYELAYADVVDRLRPDLIHANDFSMIGVGANAAVRARHAGRPVRLVYDAHEFVAGLERETHPWWHAAQVALEREFIHEADAVVTVSAEIALLLQEAHGLTDLPTVVLNAPAAPEASGPVASPPRMRDLCGITDETPLLTYSGVMAERRGVRTMVEALPRLPGVHVAFVTAKPTSPFVLDLVHLATDLGVRDRVHLLPYVPPEQVTTYLADADIGVLPLHRNLNHDSALPTKFYEYSHARLPIVCSDVRATSATVRRTGQGEVFQARDLDGYLRAVRAVLADPARYRAAYDTPGLLEEWSWSRQAEILDGVYERLVRPPG